MELNNLPTSKWQRRLDEHRAGNERSYGLHIPSNGKDDTKVKAIREGLKICSCLEGSNNQLFGSIILLMQINMDKEMDERVFSLVDLVIEKQNDLNGREQD